jgi:hypothetical protein
MKLKEFKLSEQAQQVFQLAENTAREFRHDYVGTEHVLLGLVQQGEGIAAAVLRSRGLDETRLRHAIEEVIQHGTQEVSTSELPLTPRLQQAINFAREDAVILGQSFIGTEHLLIGLLREPEGVARVILRECGLRLEEIGPEAFKIRLLQMKIVERVVRPLHASIARKRRMRDELLTHLSAIYEEELARLGDPLASVEAAATRFGDPKELAVELQATVPRREQWEARLEPIFGWRAPESVVRWMTRVGIQMGLIMSLTVLLAAFVSLREFGWSSEVWLVLRPLIGMTIATPLAVGISGICYFKIRNNLHGVFGASKSWTKAMSWALLLAAAITASGAGFLALAYYQLGVPTVSYFVVAAWGVTWAFLASLDAYGNGPRGIRDAAWAMLDLDDQRVTA